MSGHFVGRCKEAQDGYGIAVMSAGEAFSARSGLREAVVLAGGFGTRLQAVVNDRPKPMASVAGKPFLEWILLILKSQGIERVVLSTGYMGASIEEYFASGDRWELRLSYAREPKPLGTGGALRHVLEFTEATRLLVLNGDSLCRFDVSILAAQHEQAGAKTTIWLTHVLDSGRYGTVELGERNEVLAFREKTGNHCPGLISAGVYLVERDVVRCFPPGVNISLEHTLFPSLIGKGLHGVIGDGPFLDIGIPEDYEVAEAFLERLGLERGR